MAFCRRREEYQERERSPRRGETVVWFLRRNFRFPIGLNTLEAAPLVRVAWRFIFCIPFETRAPCVASDYPYQCAIYVSCNSARYEIASTSPINDRRL